jgi:hypothetical protein
MDNNIQEMKKSSYLIASTANIAHIFVYIILFIYNFILGKSNRLFS